MRTVTLFIKKYLKKPVVIHNINGILTVYGDERNFVSVLKDSNSDNTYQSIIFKTDNDITFIGKSKKINNVNYKNMRHYEQSYDDKLIESMINDEKNYLNNQESWTRHLSKQLHIQSEILNGIANTIKYRKFISPKMKSQIEILSAANKLALQLNNKEDI